MVEIISYSCIPPYLVVILHKKVIGLGCTPICKITPPPPPPPGRNDLLPRHNHSRREIGMSKLVICCLGNGYIMSLEKWSARSQPSIAIGGGTRRGHQGHVPSLKEILPHSAPLQAVRCGNLCDLFCSEQSLN